MIVAQSSLTPRQLEVYNLIRDRLTGGGLPPTVREIAAGLQISVNGVVCHLKALERRGFISRKPYAARGIQLARRPIPLLGRISAGALLDAVEFPELISFESLFGDDQLQAVSVEDESLVGAHCRRGDYLLCDRLGRTVGMIRRIGQG